MPYTPSSVTSRSADQILSMAGERPGETFGTTEADTILSIYSPQVIQGVVESAIATDGATLILPNEEPLSDSTRPSRKALTAEVRVERATIIKDRADELGTLSSLQKVARLAGVAASTGVGYFVGETLGEPDTAYAVLGFAVGAAGVMYNKATTSNFSRAQSKLQKTKPKVTASL